MAEVIVQANQQPVMQIVPNPPAGVPASPDASAPLPAEHGAGKWWLLVIVLVVLVGGLLAWYLMR